MKIKKVIRKFIQETNSSSSHSLVICMDDDNLIKPGDPDFDLEIIDNILYVPCRDDAFGWQYDKSNSPRTKLQYAAGLVCYSINQVGDHKRIKKFKNALISYLGVSDIIFEWDTIYKESLKNGAPFKYYRPYPEIDHQSFDDSKEEIFETNETLIKFIFSKDSWWYGGNDNSDEIIGFKGETELIDVDPSALISIDFGGEIGKVDFELPVYPCNLFDALVSDPDQILTNLRWNINENKLITDSYAEITSIYETNDDTTVDLKWNYDIYVDSETNKSYIVFTKPYVISTALSVNYITTDWIHNTELVDGIDYKLFPLSIYSFKFGKIC